MTKKDCIIQRTYKLLQKYRSIIFGVIACVFIFSVFKTSNINVTQNIEVMLPDKGERLTTSYNLLQNTPLAKKTIITVSNDKDMLNEAIDAVAENLENTSAFKNILKGPGSDNALNLLMEGFLILPNIISEKDAEYLHTLTSETTIDSIMSRNLSRLSSPAWLGYKQIIENDPLELYSLFFKKLYSAVSFMDVVVDNGRFKSKDGKYGMIIADSASDSSITDIKNASHIIKSYNKALENNLPEGTEVFMISHASYSVANAKTIIKDLRTIVPISVIILISLFLIFFRNKHSAILLFVPIFAATLSAAIISSLYKDISGIVIGFSSVLLGITVDYAIHVYISVKNAVNSGYGISYGVKNIIKPVFFSAVTSMAAFSALLTSNIEGIRQFALFGIAGITSGLIISLSIIPLVFTDKKICAGSDLPEKSNKQIPAAKATISLCIFAAIIFIFSSKIHINADFKNLGYISDEIRANERKYTEIWGKMRDFTVIFSTGATEASARASNEKATYFLYKNFPALEIVTISNILPSDASQKKSIDLWNSFWHENMITVFSELNKSAEAHGFSENTFNKFKKNIRELKPPILTLDSINEKGFAGITNLFTSNQGKVYMTLLYGDASNDKLVKLEQEVENTTAASFKNFNIELAGIMRDDIIMFCTIALLSIITTLIILFRNAGEVISSLIPAAAGLAGISVVFALFNIEVNLFHIVSLPLIIGLATDYGIFITTESIHEKNTARRGVLLCGATTIAGFGVLILAQHPSLHAIGITVMTGIISAIAAAVVIIPLTVKK